MFKAVACYVVIVYSAQTLTDGALIRDIIPFNWASA